MLSNNHMSEPIALFWKGYLTEGGFLILRGVCDCAPHAAPANRVRVTGASLFKVSG